MVLQLNPVAKKVAELIEPHIERQGFELVGVEFRQGTRHSLLRLLVDKPEGGIALSDLEKLSPLVGDLLDVYDPVEGRYTFEMASPGINRPLTRLKRTFRPISACGSNSAPVSRASGARFSRACWPPWTRTGVELDDDEQPRRLTFYFEEIRGRRTTSIKFD